MPPCDKTRLLTSNNRSAGWSEWTAPVILSAGIWLRMLSGNSLNKGGITGAAGGTGADAVTATEAADATWVGLGKAAGLTETTAAALTGCAGLAGTVARAVGRAGAGAGNAVCGALGGGGGAGTTAWGASGVLLTFGLSAAVCTDCTGVCQIHQAIAKPATTSVPAAISQRETGIPCAFVGVGLGICRAWSPGTVPRPRSASARLRASSM